MNTKFFLYIFAFLTGTVLAQDAPQIVREALTQEEQRNAQEGEAASICITTSSKKLI